MNNNTSTADSNYNPLEQVPTPTPPAILRERRYNRSRNIQHIPKSQRGYMLGAGINKLSGEMVKTLPEFRDSKGQKFIRKPNGQVVKVDKFPSEAVKEFNNSLSHGDIKMDKVGRIIPQVVV